jgi:hypothetical protein
VVALLAGDVRHSFAGVLIAGKHPSLPVVPLVRISPTAVRIAGWGRCGCGPGFSNVISITVPELSTLTIAVFSLICRTSIVPSRWPSDRMQDCSLAGCGGLEGIGLWQSQNKRQVHSPGFANDGLDKRPHSGGAPALPPVESPHAARGTTRPQKKPEASLGNTLLSQRWK